MMMLFDELIEIETHIDAQAIHERMAIVDVRMAADELRTVFDRTHGAGWLCEYRDVSLPGTRYRSEHRRSPASLGQSASAESDGRESRQHLTGIPAIEALMAEGINVNVTLVYSLAHYEAAVGAYLRGIERTPDPAALRRWFPSGEPNR